MTAALPKSLARLDSPCCSSEMRSTAASTLELSSSTISTSTSVPIIRMRSTTVAGMMKAHGSRTAHSVSSWRNALSSSMAKRMPLMECLSANHARVRPRLPLCGLSAGE